MKTSEAATAGIELQKVRNVETSNCRSFGSNQHPCGRFPKISIGITVEKTPRVGSESRKEDVAALSSLRSASICLKKVLEEDKGPDATETVETGHMELNDGKSAAGFFAGSAFDQTPTRNSFQFCAKRTTIQQDCIHTKADTVASGKRTESGDTERVKEAPSGDAVHKKSDTITYETRRYSKNTEKVEEVAIFRMKEMDVGDKGKRLDKPDKVVSRNNEALRMKLWEILGSAPSQNMQTDNSSILDELAKKSNIDPEYNHQAGETVKPKQNSDTIEADTESPKRIVKRPITRSTTLKKAATRIVNKLQHESNHAKKPSSRSGTKPKLQKSIFAFGEGPKEAGSSEGNKQGQPSSSRRKRNGLKNNEIKTLKSSFPQQIVQEKYLQTNGKGHALASADTVSLRNKGAGSLGVPRQPKDYCSRTHDIPKANQTLRTSTEVRQDSQTIRVDAPRHIHSPQFPNRREIYGTTGSPFQRTKSHPRELVPEKLLQTNEKEHKVVSADTASLRSKNVGVSLSQSCQSKAYSRTLNFSKASQTLQTSTEVHKGGQTSRVDTPILVNSPQLPNRTEIYETTVDPFMKTKSHSSEDLKSPSVLGNECIAEDRSPPWTRRMGPLDDLQSPTFAMNETPPLRRSITPDDTPLVDQPNTFCRRLFSSRSSSGSGPGSCGSDVHAQFSDDSGETLRSAGKKPRDEVVQEDEAEKQLSLSPTEGQDALSIGTDAFTNRSFEKIDGSFWNGSSAEKSPFSLRHIERINSFGIAERNKTKVSLASPYGTEEITLPCEDLEQFPEESLARATVQLASILQRFKIKVNSHTSKKSSEILACAADKLHEQILDVESHIQADLGKFAKVNKLKRRHLESKFEEQQQKLRLIHDQFKEDLNQHLMDCRSALEEFKTHNVELKGSVERQKASHKKLLLQVEEEMKVRLRDAETSILAVHKEARKKMKGLKYVLREFIGEDMMG